ncbi:Hypothetical Protein FCC1311_018332 [Hondaea fermentalgiana]|uniref:Uncharacterized protein n=1 Tax=Hondaea fermentalgiana TaxID=2315210 RepID=A0A2R5GCW7_9STRA|nr:Hypothetical Protein FCC1311_018332 [Hondaea fermentalgiana]|eukprot:GBG25614.1 Hypothetical Protein FCC1311_018332 [Hondaea fermentalgiana]
MENRFSLELPHELRESLMIHDGQNHADVDPSEQPFPRLYTLAEMMGFYTEKLSRSMLMLSAEEDPTLELVPVAEDRLYVNVRTGVVCRLPDPFGPTILSVDPSWSAYLTVQ